MATFGTWAAKNSNNPEMLIHGAEVIDACNRMTKIINRSFGWIQPLSFYSYESWYTASQFYSDSLKAQVLAQNPELFVGKKIEIDFMPKSIEVWSNGWNVMMNGSIGYISPDGWAGLERIRAKGIMIRENNRFIIDGRSEK